MPPVSQSVVELLKIQDIALWESHLTRGVDYPQIEGDAQIEFQTMRNVRVDSVSAVDEHGQEVDILKIFVRLGVRCLAASDSNGDETEQVIYTLESIFSVDYIILQELLEEEVSEFARFNAVHNVWPFWRQHVYDSIKKASLPVPEVPFFAGNSRTSLPADTLQE